MSTQEQKTHLQSSYQHHDNHQHTTYRCYLRTPDMRCKIEEISTDQSVRELKEQVKNLLGLASVSQAAAIKLIVNETQLTDDMNLALHLFHNAIIHVIVPQQRDSQDQNTRQISLKIKQPPIDCPPYTLENIPFNLSVKQLRTKIIAFFQQADQSNPIGSLSPSGLYLVYGGRILTDDKALGDYDIDPNGILYVINGNIYARQVTKEEAERRIEEVKRGQYNETQTSVAEPVEQATPFAQENSSLNEYQDLVFNIIQNIVHDSDSDMEGEKGDDMGRSQKIIHRYDSINNANNMLSLNEEQDQVVAQKQPNIDEAQEQEFKQQISEHLSRLAEQITQRPEVQEDAPPQQEGGIERTENNEGRWNGDKTDQVQQNNRFEDEEMLL